MSRHAADRSATSIGTGGLVKRGALKMLAFSAPVAITGIVTLVSIPLIIRHTGADAWAAIAVGQASGAAVALVGMLGWATTGPAAVARGTVAERRALFIDSLWSRLPLVFITVPAAAGISTILAPTHHSVALICGVASVLTSLSAGWYFIGSGSPARLAFLDTMPRVIGIVIGVVLLGWGFGTTAYAWCQLAGSVAVAAVSTVAILAEPAPPEECTTPGGVLHAARVIRRQAAGLTTSLTSAIYLTLPVLVVAQLAPTSLPLYALADRLRQQALMAVSPVNQTLQGWVPRGGADMQTRINKATIVSIVVGVFVAVLFGALIPKVSSIVGGGIIVITYCLSIPLGLSAGLNVVTATLGVTALASYGAYRELALSSLSGAVIGVLLIPILAFVFGGFGAAWGVVGAQAAVLVFLIHFVKRRTNGQVLSYRKGVYAYQ